MFVSRSFSGCTLVLQLILGWLFSFFQIIHGFLELLGLDGFTDDHTLQKVM